MNLPVDFYEPVKFKHDVVYYIPVFFKNDGTFPHYPNFTYSMEYATDDYNMAASMEPDYILTLTGKFEATTPPILDYLTQHGNGD